MAVFSEKFSITSRHQINCFIDCAPTFMCSAQVRLWKSFLPYLIGFADATHGFDGPLPVQVVNFGLLCCSCFRRWLSVHVFEILVLNMLRSVSAYPSIVEVVCEYFESR